MRTLRDISLAIMFAAIAATAAATVDTEALAKQNGAEFHWFPIQKTFILVDKTDTLKFAVGLPYATSHGLTVELSRAPAIEGGHIVIDSADAAKFFKATPAKEAEKPASSIAAKSSDAKVATSSSASKTSAAT